MFIVRRTRPQGSQSSDDSDRPSHDNTCQRRPIFRTVLLEFDYKRGWRRVRRRQLRRPWLFFMFGYMLRRRRRGFVVGRWRFIHSWTVLGEGGWGNGNAPGLRLFVARCGVGGLWGAIGSPERSTADRSGPNAWVAGPSRWCFTIGCSAAIRAGGRWQRPEYVASQSNW